MKYKISNAYAIVNGQNIAVGAVLGEEDKPESPFTTEYVTNTEYEKGLKNFTYGQQVIGDMVFHCVAEFNNLKSERPVEEKWIKELEKMGYDTSKLIYEVKQ